MMARQSVFVCTWSLILAIGLFSESSHAFSSNFQRRASAVSASMSRSKTTAIFSTPPDGEESEGLDAFSDPLTANKPPVPDSTPNGTSYPIDVPSPILLGSSMVLAIIGVGSVFDIFADEPRFPFVINATISAGGLAICLGLFYASILKAQAETEIDDEKYMSGR